MTTRQLAEPEPSNDDWYVNLLWFDRRKCLLLAHVGTLFPVFVADVRKADLTPLDQWLANVVRRELNAESLPAAVLGELAPPIVLAKTASRQMLGFMNEMARFAEYAIADAGGLARCDIAKLNREQRRMLHNRNGRMCARSTSSPSESAPFDYLSRRWELKRCPSLVPL